ncbi:hypothetical protein [Cognatazoarcus halotolerans]|uniref:hypothetical protein n=1 Tax=Cognatazoarcus halotolerans TaxID=2686016 RepID=UPI00135CA983|nr:hypothetical protein [Cognatazoarcus halotolerans]MBX3679817.1 hypothetical protein [Rhodocyclaceae bacterium]MCB1901899.1 hypothetical protein [Rhodocyclaceae bacterium]MCP5310952.1 hypothetical protein [Zoogloeaceae bacterium]
MDLTAPLLDFLAVSARHFGLDDAELRAGRASAARRAWTTVEPSREQPKRDGDMQGTSVRGEESCCG